MGFLSEDCFRYALEPYKAGLRPVDLPGLTRTDWMFVHSSSKPMSKWLQGIEKAMRH
jgi:hypothetical protein